MKALSIAPAMIFLGIGLAVAQQVEIQSLSGNGQIAWTAPSNSDCTVEWAGTLSPTTTWSRTWGTLTDINSSNETYMATVPMFYRVSCWTNGLFLRLPVGRTFVYGVSNALGETWTEEFAVVANARFPAMSNDYQLLVVSQHWDGEMPSGASDEPGSVFIRSTDTGGYVLNHLSGTEILGGWRQAPVGTTYAYVDEDGDPRVTTLETNEMIVVPAGAFENCLKFHNISPGDTSVPTWDEWVKPGFFLVKWVDYHVDPSNAAPVVYQLESWHSE